MTKILAISDSLNGTSYLFAAGSVRVLQFENSSNIVGQNQKSEKCSFYAFRCGNWKYMYFFILKTGFKVAHCAKQYKGPARIWEAEVAKPLHLTHCFNSQAL